MFMPETLVGENFNTVYGQLLELLMVNGTPSINRKGDTVVELFDAAFRLTNPSKCLATRREMSMDYLEKELNFYMGGSDKLSDAMKMSKFWEKCSDDGKTINSNYGKLIFHDKNLYGNTQFQHALNCLCNNLQSKKAVMTLYNKENAYISNDNPCTMFLRVRVDKDCAVHMSTYMRSSDVYFGLPYDVPFFCFVLIAMKTMLSERKRQKFTVGTYTHHASSLHYYKSKQREIECAIQNTKVATLGVYEKLDILFYEAYNKLKALLFNPHEFFMQRAWEEADKSPCLKKKVGACFAEVSSNASEEIAAHCGRVKGDPCKTCIRDHNKSAPKDKQDMYYGDSCPSVHAEMWCVTECFKKGYTDFSNVIVYVTHGPCDACLKLLDLIGVTKVVYDKPYKTDYSHWPSIDVRSLKEARAKW